MDAYPAAEARYELQKLVHDLNGLVAQALTHRKELLVTKQSFEDVARASKLNSFTLSIYRERFRRGLSKIDNSLLQLYGQRNRAQAELRKSVS